jgi:hypothetical protein
VTIGPYVAGPQGERVVELSRVSLPRSLSPGESVTVELTMRADQVGPGQTITVDLVREWIFWFAEGGSKPLVLPVPEP